LDQIDAAIDRIKPDITVFVGDYFDSFIYDHHDHVRRTANWLKRGLAHPDRVYLLGNHDLPYAYPYLATCPGWTSEKHRVIRTVLEDADWAKFQLLYSPNASWLFSHAGVSRSLVPEEVSDVPEWLSVQVDVGLSFMKFERPHWIFCGGRRRGGSDVGGPLWCDFSDFEPVPNLNQVFGHTPPADGQPLMRQKNTVDSTNICIDAGGSKGLRSVLLLDDESLTEIPL